MGFRISTNVQSLAAQRNLMHTHEKQNKSLEKLAAGERIVRAGDDAAGMAISEKLKSEIRSLKQANRNANDAISMIQTGEGGLSEIQNILIRLRELSMQAASDSVGDIERGFTDKEVRNLVSEVERIAQVTRYDGTYLLNGTGGIYEFQIGINNNPELDRLNYDTAIADSTTTRLGIGELSVLAKQDAQANLDVIDNAIKMVSENRSHFGALQNRLQSTINNLTTAEENIASANSRIRDVDVAFQASELTKENILSQAGTAMLAQANSNGLLALKLLG